MDKKQVFATGIVAAGLGGVFINLLSEVIKYMVDLAWGKPLEQGQRTIIWVVALLIAGGVLWITLTLFLTDRVVEKIVKFLRPQFFLRVRAELEKEAYERSRGEQEEQAGIAKTYLNFNFCKDDILTDMKAAKEVRIFLHLGRTVLRTESLFWKCLEEIILKPEVSVKILHAGKQNPYFSRDKEQARPNPKKLSTWDIDLDSVARLIEGVKNKKHLGSRFSGRQHNEGAFWRIFIFDEVAYVQAYSYDSDNEGQAPVFKLARRTSSSGQHSEKKLLYEAFLRYFDNKWEEYASTSVITA